MISKIAAGRSIVCPCLSSALAAQELVGAARPHAPGIGEFRPPGRGENWGLRAPESRGSDLVGAARPHTPGVSGATRPRTPRFTFGRPKVNRKTAKTKVLDSFFQSVFIRFGTSLPLNFVLFLIYSLAVNDAPPAGLLKRDMFHMPLSEVNPSCGDRAFSRWSYPADSLCWC